MLGRINCVEVVLHIAPKLSGERQKACGAVPGTQQKLTKTNSKMANQKDVTLFEPDVSVILDMNLASCRMLSTWYKV